MNWLYLFLGLDNASGSKYLFWSGFGSDITEFAVLGALAGLLRKHNCETHRCWRLGRHAAFDAVNGTTHTFCRKHHPRGSISPADAAKMTFTS